ncbi:MAG: DUF1559 domain-containing protein [Planctomycetaceae bacterium]
MNRIAVRRASLDRLTRRAFTLVELLVSIAVIVILIALLLPAVQTTREAARRTHCRNNLRQMAVGAQNFHSTYESFPGNGWGFAWVGEPDRAAGVSQPAGWIYQLLPQLEAANVWSIGAGTTGPDRRQSLAQLCGTRLPLFKCPSRPTDQMGPQTDVFRYRNADTPESVARTDYAINEGDYITGTGSGPQTLEEGDDPDYVWKDVSLATGVSWLRTGARIADITDGTSNTYLIGEKYVSTFGYHQKTDRGYDQTMFAGVDLDLARWTLQTPIQDEEVISERSFGSAHTQACSMAMCDGSVRSISYGIDQDVHRWLGNRMDGQVSVP